MLTVVMVQEWALALAEASAEAWAEAWAQSRHTHHMSLGKLLARKNNLNSIGQAASTAQLLHSI